jgi:hypothetical protein
MLLNQQLIRVGMVAGGGAGLATVFAIFWRSTPVSENAVWWQVALIAAGALLLVGLEILVSIGLFAWAADMLARLSVTTERPAGRVRVLVLAAAVAAVLLWPRPMRILLTDAAVASLPAAFVLAFGGWLGLLAWRRVRRSRHRVLRHIPDVLVIVFVGVGLVVLFDRHTLTAAPAAGLLFPVGAWFSVLTWRAMTRSGRLAVRAGADIVMSLLLGTDLVLFLVWAAELLNLPRGEVAAVRETLERAGSLAELPWWLWADLYLLLAGIAVAVALWPAPGARIADRARWRSVVRVTDVGRRVLSGVHIGLLVAVLIGVAAPAALEPTLRADIRNRYVVAVQRELDAAAEQAAYREIHQQFSRLSPASVGPLGAVVRKVHDIGRSAAGDDGLPGIERELARRMGQLQADTLRASTPPAESPADLLASARPAWLDQPIQDTDGPLKLSQRLDTLDGQQTRADTVTRFAEQAGELAAIAVAGTLQIPDIGQNEIVQIIREYLSGLVESSPLKDIFAAQARRLAGPDTVAPASELVVPNPYRLRIAALSALTAQYLKTRLAQPFARDQAMQRALREAPIDAAVDLANEARYLSEPTGPCAGCPRPLRPGEAPKLPGEHGRPGERPAEPPRIHIR